MKKVIVAGTCGSGKTTLGKALSAKLGCELVDLDDLYWLPGWQRRDPNEFNALIEKATNKPSWIVCGNYSKHRELFWPKADTIIWMDLPIWVLCYRLVKRSVIQAFSRKTLCNGNTQSFGQFCWLICHLFKTYRRRKRNYRELMHKKTHLNWIHVRSSEQVRQLLGLVA